MGQGLCTDATSPNSTLARFNSCPHDEISLWESLQETAVTLVGMVLGFVCVRLTSGQT